MGSEVRSMGPMFEVGYKKAKDRYEPKWTPISEAMNDPLVVSGEKAVLAVHTNSDFYQVVFWDQEAADRAGRNGTLGSGYGWTTMDQEVRYHTEFFSHYMHLPARP